MPRLLAIGDIHGCSVSLRTLLETVLPRSDDRVITLGDYFNKGPDSKGVIEQLLHLQSVCILIPLKGNHEQMFLDESGAEDYLALFDAEVTLKSYGASRLADIPAEHLAFVRSCRAYHETEKHFFVHASVDAYAPLECQTEHSLLWTHVYEAPAQHISGKTMICGHTPQKGHKPTHWGTAICIDSGVAAPEGWLTCLEITSHGYRYWQANQRGERRQDVLVGPDTDDLND